MRKILESLYRSKFGTILTPLANFLAFFHKPFMVYGFRDPKTKKFHKYTRFSSSAVILSKQNLSIANEVWVWHYSIIDATEGITIEEGAQIGAWVGIFTHGSEKSVRLLGPRFVHIPSNKRLGYTRGPVHIGAYSFLGAGSVVLPGVTIGKGCLISTGTLVTKDIPNYSIVVGWPGKIVGSTIDMDAKAFAEYDYSDTYYDQEALSLVKDKLASAKDSS